MRTAIGGGTARFDIEVFDSADAVVTGLVTGNFTKRLTIDGVSDATTITVTEVANGRYTVTFTAPAVTAGNVKYVRCWLLHATYAPRGWAEDFEVYNVNVLSGVAQTGDNYARLGAPAGASVSADIAAMKTDTAAILVDTGTTLDGRIPAALIGGRMDANIGAISADATAADNAEAFFDGTGYAGTGNTIPTVTTVTTLTTYTGNTPQTGDSFARLGAPAGVSVSADVAAVKVDTAAILVDTGTTLDGRIPAALVGGRMDASVGAVAAGAITAAAIADDAIDAGAIATGAITAAKFAAGAIDAAAIADNAIDAGAIATDAIAATKIAAGAANKIADHVLRRSTATAAASANGDTVAFRSLLGAVRKQTNKCAVVGTDLKTYEEDDTTAAGTQAITENSSANPIVGLDTT